jgi:hypothetical protein
LYRYAAGKTAEVEVALTAELTGSQSLTVTPSAPDVSFLPASAVLTKDVPNATFVYTGLAVGGGRVRWGLSGGGGYDGAGAGAGVYSASTTVDVFASSVSLMTDNEEGNSPAGQSFDVVIILQRAPPKELFISLGSTPGTAKMIVSGGASTPLKGLTRQTIKVTGLGVGAAQVNIALSGEDAPDYGIADGVKLSPATSVELQITPCPSFACAPDVTTVAVADNVRLNARAVAVAPGGEALFVAEPYKIVRLALPALASPSPAATDVAGASFGASAVDATGGDARFVFIAAIAVAPTLGTAGKLLVLDGGCVRTVDLATAAVAFLAGHCTSQGLADGGAADARFRSPRAVTMSPDDATAYVADSGNHAIRAVVVATGAVSTLAGGGGAGRSGFVDSTPLAAMFNNPTGLAVVPGGAGGGVHALLVADRNNGRLRWVNAATGATSTATPTNPLPGSSGDVVLGNVPNSTVADYGQPSHVALVAGGPALFFDDALNEIKELELTFPAAGDAAAAVTAARVVSLVGNNVPGEVNVDAAARDGLRDGAVFKRLYGITVTADGAAAYAAHSGAMRRVTRRLRALTAAAPNASPLSGGTDVTLRLGHEGVFLDAGSDAAAVFTFGGATWNVSLQWNRTAGTNASGGVAATAVTFTTPAAPAGVAAGVGGVKLCAWGQITAEVPFILFEDAALEAHVAPPQGNVSGGTRLLLRTAAAAVDSRLPLAVRFSSVASPSLFADSPASFTGNPGGELEVMTPPWLHALAADAAAGGVPVVLALALNGQQFPTGAAAGTATFLYYDVRVRADGAVPRSGPVTGGTNVTVTAAGLAAAAAGGIGGGGNGAVSAVLVPAAAATDEGVLGGSHPAGTMAHVPRAAAARLVALAPPLQARITHDNASVAIDIPDLTTPPPPHLDSFPAGAGMDDAFYGLSVSAVGTPLEPPPPLNLTAGKYVMLLTLNGADWVRLPRTFLVYNLTLGQLSEVKGEPNDVRTIAATGLVATGEARVRFRMPTPSQVREAEVAALVATPQGGGAEVVSLLVPSIGDVGATHVDVALNGQQFTPVHGDGGNHDVALPFSYCCLVIDKDTSRVVGPGAVATLAGEDTSFVVQTVHADGRNLTEGGHDLTVVFALNGRSCTPEEGAGGAMPAGCESGVVTDLDNGHYSVSFNLETAAPWTIRMTFVDGVTDASIPFDDRALTVYPALAAFSSTSSPLTARSLSNATVGPLYKLNPANP